MGIPGKDVIGVKLNWSKSSVFNVKIFQYARFQATFSWLGEKEKEKEDLCRSSKILLVIDKVWILPPSSESPVSSVCTLPVVLEQCRDLPNKLKVHPRLGIQNPGALLCTEKSAVSLPLAVLRGCRVPHGISWIGRRCQ